MNHVVNPALLASVPRIDPRRPAIITPAGLRRIVLGSTEGERSAARSAHHAAARGLRAPGPFQRVALVVAHAERGTLDGAAQQAVAAAAILATADTEVVLAVLGACHDDAASLGADRVLLLPQAGRDEHGPDTAAAWLAALHAQLKPVVTYLPDRDADADLGRRFAVSAGLSLAASVIEVQRPAQAGEAPVLRVRAGATEDALCRGAQVVLLQPGVVKADLPYVGIGRAWDNAVDGAAPAWVAREPEGLVDLGVQAGDASTVALEEADFILSAGNGVTDLALFQQLADALGAATGASRVAVDDGRFPRSKQIGATGKTVKATTYMAIGISGAVQHLQGIKDCRHVIAVNTDSAAPIVRRASVVAVEEGAALMRELLALLQAHREAKSGASTPSLKEAA